MINPKNPSKIFIDDNSVFTDASLDLNTFSRDSVSMVLVAAEDYLYYGRYKPFPALYFEFSTANTNAGTLTVEYYNGSTWNAVSELLDETKHFTRSGFIYFEQPDDWATVAVNGSTQYWLRFKPSVDLSAGTSLLGASIIYSDDRDLEAIYPGVLNYRASSESSYILRHQNARDEIVQELRNKGFRKVDSTGTYQQYEPWDLLNIFEVNRWSTYRVLENIFSSLQSTEDGLYKQKADEYREKANEYENAFYITLDKDDDGVVDASESSGDIMTRGIIRG